MFTHKLGLTFLFSFLVWLGATMFFVLFGDLVLVDPSKDNFLGTFLLLEAATAIVLYVVLLIYKKLDKSPYASIKLGIWGSAIGLFIDTFSVWNHSIVFPKLSEDQVIAFTIWMVCAYAMYLIIPLGLSNKKE
ncbi:MULTISPECIES: DUF5367 family protein [Aneurinibacillus]|uniref:DUF5367 family protein n=1 Tax=Aneurinibacillus thermoaerophilus TaxID=143495 RepID=A0A1G7Y387_ANETH|nr:MULTISPECIES: DUF5367 family protein [Aneurinibacillus]MED0675883.1 DUF5367 family protein [Aneurinibacillus thermoaerophilus]MED0677842.1 DUF5367 family protein [Aneurinibacillus thermoaerophilus]MED0737591.1 DUF5367 family protein [Aneurinibacillus thermoaerophilus]MED0758162.1 DUF5367 family protein [Aneurinibacillus thermoaerophilus]MED0761316.1 DUF5367 family protein [Aneurinibacillus thermoaerophilus]